MSIIVAATIGIVIGAVLGLTGAGGSIFAVPLLIIFLGLAPSEAMGVALGAVMVSALLGTVRQRKQVIWLPVFLLSVGGVLGAPLGKLLSLYIHDTTLVLGFSAIALFIATRMLYQALTHPEFSANVRAALPEVESEHTGLACRLSPTGQFQIKPRCIGGLVSGGILIGLASGLFGVGGGFLIVPLLLFLSALSMPKAVATSLATITLISASGFVSHLVLSGLTKLTLLFVILSGATFGMLLSQGVSKKIAGQKLQIIFSVLLIAVALSLLIKHFF